MRIEINKCNDTVNWSNVRPGTILQNRSDPSILVLYWGNGANKDYFHGIKLSEGKGAVLCTGNKEDYKIFIGSVTLTQ